MPKKGYRITVSLFKELIGINKYFRGEFLNILYKKNTKSLKFSVVVSKKIFKKATKRNKLKRQLREIIKKYLNENDYSDFYAVFIVKKGIEKLDYNDLKTKIVEDLRLFIK